MRSTRLALAVFALFGTAEVALAQGRRPTVPVEVQNTPGVEVINTPGVEVINTPEVVVGNSSSSPVPVAPQGIQEVNIVGGLPAGAPLPSEIVTLIARSGPGNQSLCNNYSGSIVFDRQLFSNGTIAPFSVPAGKVLIVTDASISGGNNGATAQQAQGVLFLGSADVVSLDAVLGSETFPATTGIIQADMRFSPGIPLRPGPRICAGFVGNFSGSRVGSVVHGYVTDDR